MKTKLEKLMCAIIWTMLTFTIVSVMMYPMEIYFKNYYVHIINGIRIDKNFNIMILNLLGALSLTMLFYTIKAVALVFQKKFELKLIKKIKLVFINKTILSTIFSTLLFIAMIFIIKFHHINIYNSKPLYYRICVGVLLNVIGILLWKISSYVVIGIILKRRR